MENLAEDYETMSLRQMAKKYGVSAMTIKKRLNKLGVDTSYNKSMRPDMLNNREELKRQISNGRSLSSVAKSVGADIRTVKAAINRKTDEEIYYCDWRQHFDNHKKCSKWLLKYGFRHPKYDSNTLTKFMRNMLKVKPTLNANYNSQHTMNFIRHFSEHFYYSTHKGYNCVPDAWGKGNTIVLKQAVKLMWEHGKKCNIFSLMSVISRHFRDFTTVSIFKPWVASFIYDKYLPNGGVVVDPTMGWGGRLIGCNNRNIKYCGFDINQNSVNANLKISKFLFDNSCKIDCEIKQADSSVIDFPNGDLLFTSPPYNDTEHYYGIDSSKTVTEPIFDNIFSKFDGIIAINLPKRQESLCIHIADKHDRKFVELLKMKTVSFMGREKTYEPILIFH